MRGIIAAALVAAPLFATASAQADTFDVSGRASPTGWRIICQDWTAAGPREAVANCQKYVGGLTSRIEYVSQAYATQQPSSTFKTLNNTTKAQRFFCDLRFKNCPR